MNKSLKQIVDERLMPFFKSYLSEVCEKKENLIVDGIKVFSERDPFLPGELVGTNCDILVNLDRESKEFEWYLANLKILIEFAATRTLKTWGLYFFIYGLHTLDKNGLLDKVVDGEILEKLKRKLDWKDFINPEDLSFIPNMPTNYYGVALRIAGYRELLGWENENSSKRLYRKLMERADTYSGEYGYMDETEGEGRYDLYTHMMPGEIHSILSVLGMEIPENIRKMLKNTYEIFTHLANDKGYGFSHGRSIGAHADMGVSIVLTGDASMNDVLEDRKEAYYAYVVKNTEKYLDFWVSEETNLITLWEKGRRTDGYRHKGRILEVNIDRFKVIYDIYIEWKKLGYADKVPQPGCEKTLLNLPDYKFFRFAKGEYDRGLAIVRDKGHVFSLPVINGGTPYYCYTPYLPVPYEPLVLEAPPDTQHPHLVPRITLEDGKSVMPLTYIKNITAEEGKEEYILKYEQDELCLLGGKSPGKYSGITSKTTYRCTVGMIEREDTFYPSEICKVKELRMEFGTFSEAPVILGSKVVFNKGDIYEFGVEGMAVYSIDRVEGDEEYKTTHGPLKFNVVCKKNNFEFQNQYIVRWKLKYR